MKDPYVVCSALAMPRGSVLSIEEGCDLLVYVWQGGLWLTQERDGRDRWLGAGASFRLDRNGLALAQATCGTTVTLSAPEPAPYAQRITLSRPGDAAPLELYAAARPRRLWVDWFAPHARPTTAAL
jgi:hypothetical protein